jgi:flavin-dependent dehydrogenase
MAQLGHDVCLIERVVFPRDRLGESLSPGVLPLLEMIGAREDVERAGFRRVTRVSTTWDGDLDERDADPLGLLVDRGRFDTLLLERARTLGVRVLQPASIVDRRRDGDRWILRVDAAGQSMDLEANVLADAGGRTAALPGRRSASAVRTFALYGYWRGSSLPEQPRIEAGADAWYWGVPLPDGRYNTLVFVDAARLREEHAASITGLFQRLIAASGLMTGCHDAQIDGDVHAVDATPYLDEDCVTASSIKIGDAALAIDPLSSSGVQKAIQSALSGAIVANTLIRKPEARDAATRFYRSSLEQTSARHHGWAAEHYAAVASRLGGAFWDDRATGVSGPAREASRAPEARPSTSSLVGLSPLVEFVDLPCIDGDFVTVKTAVRHPELDSPLAYLGGWELAPLLNNVTPGMTPIDVVRSWSGRVPTKSGMAIASWLLDHRILVPR